ncbi:MAG: cell division protein FtsL [Thalassovita sp.]
MRSVLYVLTALAVIGSAFWAYHENYKTQAALDHADDLHRKIAQSRARLGMLRAEWAYLNRPDRLRELVVINYERMELTVFAPNQFGRVDQVAYPTLDALADVSDSVEVRGQQ